MTATQTWYIGRDVGAWNCEKNTTSHDALLVLNQQGELVGKPWRGNLRDTIAAAASYTDWLFTVAKLCQFDDTTITAFTTQNTVMAIDTPLGFSNGLLQLLQGEAVATPFTASCDNPYLYRYTERELFAHGFSPLSAVKDMIGSQATKGLHLLRKFGFTTSENGVWQLNQSSQNQCQHSALESYPTVLKNLRLGCTIHRAIAQPSRLQQLAPRHPRRRLLRHRRTALPATTQHHGHPNRRCYYRRLDLCA